MIKFFRKIRQRLLSENKFSKYLIYAIGEIVLVVIGILIALSINNWNEENKESNKVKSLLVALKNDLAQDTLLINENLPEVKKQLNLNESLRARVANPDATIDTLIKIVRFEFNPNWDNPVLYNTNAYNSLVETDLIEQLTDSMKLKIKNFYNQKFYLNGMVKDITQDYRSKIRSYVDTYTFGSTSLHDQGKLIDSIVWSKIDLQDLAAKFQGMSNFKRIVFRLSKNDLEYSMENSKKLIGELDKYIDENNN